ncbi:MAG: acyl-CoA dehydrogenase family protein [Acidimicrobiales bacterium]
MDVRSPHATTESPFEVLDRLAPLVREQIAEAEAQRSLSPVVAQAMVDGGLLRLLTPASLGGGEIDPVGLYKVVEAAARIDGSFGWCLMILSGTGLLARAMSEHEALALLGDPTTVVAGAAFPFNKAVAVEGGYRVSGRWPFASGCLHATHLMGFSIVHDGDAPRMGPGGPDIRVRVAPAGDVEIVENWEVVGLQGTGSHDIVFDNVFVPEGRAVPLGDGKRNRYYEGALYRMPFMALFAWPVAAVALGIAQHSIDSAIELSQEKVPAGAGSAVRLSNDLQRCMRDLHAVSQHVVTGPATWEQAGVVLAGLPPINPMIML